MGTALAAGLLASKRVRPSQIMVADVRPEMLKSMKKRFGVRVSPDNRTAVKDADIVLLCVKPQQMAQVLDELRGQLSVKTLIISIAAGIRIKFMEDRLSAEFPVIRVMPNTPALFQAGAMAYCLGQTAKPAHEKLAAAILSSAGKIWKVAEEHMDAVTALSGSGPAYVFLLAECMTAAGKSIGLEDALAEALVRQTVYGAGLMLSQSPETAAVLRERVTSPGGTTAAALKVLEDQQIRTIFQNALAAASRRSRELSGG